MAESEAIKLQRLAEIQAITAVATVFEDKLTNLRGKFSDLVLRLEAAEKGSKNFQSKAMNTEPKISSNQEMTA